jgi:multidrug efflux pump subunit AcrA (membrane-fusion protein)
LETETQARVGLKVEPLLAATRQPEIAAYGSLQENPAHAFTLRAPVAGDLRAAEAKNWPDLNQHLDAGVLVGYVEPRLTQTERIDLAARLAQARADAAEAAAALAVAQSSYENKRKLNAEDKAVSDRALEEAQAKVKSEEARLSAATQTVRLLESAESPADQRAARFELRTEQAGQVVESLARPGEAVEAGQVLLRIVRFDTLLARVEVPVGEPYDESASIARIVVVGNEDRALTGERIGLGISPTGTTHGPTLLFRVPTVGLAIRPGAAIVAYVPAPGGMHTGVMIPRSAVIRLLGRPWVYVQADDESFVRRELSGAEPIDDSWFATSGFHPSDRVVTDGVQVLLSEELKAQIDREEAAAR